MLLHQAHCSGARGHGGRRRKRATSAGHGSERGLVRDRVRA